MVPLTTEMPVLDIMLDISLPAPPVPTPYFSAGTLHDISGCQTPYGIPFEEIVWARVRPFRGRYNSFSIVRMTSIRTQFSVLMDFDVSM
jgi:hypothetical protein